MIYADYNGSAPLHPQVATYLKQRIDKGPYANPNAIHSLGQKMLMGFEKCREICAKALGADSTQIIFTSGASEGISQVFHSVLTPFSQKKNIIISSNIEHSAIGHAWEYYSAMGYEIVLLDTKASGVIDIENFKNTLSAHQGKIALVNIMAANNETGVIQPFSELAKLCSAETIPYFSDTTQLIGKSSFHFEESNIDYAVLSGHKLGALPGVGILIAKDPLSLKPIIFGGGQENGHRGGTQNYIGAETLAVALTSVLSEEEQTQLKITKDLKENFEKNIKKRFPNTVIIGEDVDRLPTTTLISYPGIHGQAVQIELESEDIFVTTSSACSDNEPETSKVLSAMDINDDIGRGVIRISMDTKSDQDSYLKLEEALIQAYSKLEKIKSY